MHNSFSQGSFCIVLQWKSCYPLVSMYMHIRHRHFFPSMTKTKHQWLPSLHHGYQADGGLGKLNTKYLGGDEGKIRGNVSFFFFQFEHLHTRFTSVQRKHPPNCQGRGQRFPSTSPKGAPSLIAAMQLGPACWGGDGPADWRRFDLFLWQYVAAQRGWDVSSALAPKSPWLSFRGAIYFLFFLQNDTVYWELIFMSSVLRSFSLFFSLDLTELLSSLSGIDVLAKAERSHWGNMTRFLFQGCLHHCSIQETHRKKITFSGIAGGHGGLSLIPVDLKGGGVKVVLLDSVTSYYREKKPWNRSQERWCLPAVIGFFCCFLAALRNTGGIKRFHYLFHNNIKSELET